MRRSLRSRVSRARLRKGSRKAPAPPPTGLLRSSRPRGRFASARRLTKFSKRTVTVTCLLRGSGGPRSWVHTVWVSAWVLLQHGTSAPGCRPRRSPARRWTRASWLFDMRSRRGRAPCRRGLHLRARASPRAATVSLIARRSATVRHRPTRSCRNRSVLGPIPGYHRIPATGRESTGPLPGRTPESGEAVRLLEIGRDLGPRGCWGRRPPRRSTPPGRRSPP